MENRGKVRTMTTTTSTGRSLTEGNLLARIDQVLGDFLEQRASWWAAAWGGDPVVNILRRFVLDGGKRLRSRLCYWAWRGTGAPDCDEVVAAAGSLELFHAFCLVHDDLIDSSHTRRGQPTVHRAVAQLHTEQGWHGDATTHGAGVAVLIGNFLLAWSDQLWHTSGLDPERLQRAQSALAWMREEVITGEYLDLRQQAHGADSAQALWVARLKSAQYTVNRPLQFGGLLAGADTRLLAAYEDFGVPLGEAFQLRDDVLGAVGDPQATGKSTLDDFREGKPTTLIALARENSSPAQEGELNRLHGNPALDDDGADILRNILVDTGALQAVEELIERRTCTALDVLDHACLTTEARHQLRELAAATTDRTA